MRTLIAVAGVSLLLLSPVHAFNARAHRVVGHIAADHACAETAAALVRLDPERSIADAGTWADEIRANDYWDALKPWHYMNVPDGIDLTAAKRSGRGDVLLGVEKFAAELADPELDALDRQIAYRLLVHFVADIHQPLHVGRRKDRGGNDLSVRVEGQRTNLHAYWDGFELVRVVDDPREYARFLARRFAAAGVDIDGSPADWARESLQLRAQAYELPPGSTPVLTNEYRDNSLQIINLRLYQAGMRLAGLLDGIYCGATVGEAVESD